MPEIIDYIVDQADRYDAKNIQIEKDVIFLINRNVDKMISECLSRVTGFYTQLQLEQLLMKLGSIIDKYVSESKRLMLDKAQEYSETAYENTGDLIEIGKELSNNFREGVKEQKIKYDDDTIEYIQKYAFDLLTGYSNQKKQELRNKLGYLLLTGDGDKASVRELVEKVLGTNKSKSEEIAQQELSMAYNHGVLRRLNEYARISGERVSKYWHGFKYSAKTCEYCRERIGNIYPIDDDSEHLPAHVRCRCIWLPILGSWDSPVTNRLIAKANMLNTGYSIDMIYQRINNRLDIRYAEYLGEDAAYDYIMGDRSTKISNAMSTAKSNWIHNTIKSWDIYNDTTNGSMSKEYNNQMRFWKNYVAENMAENNIRILNDIKEAIKGVMMLPWTAQQLQGWQSLLSKIK